MPIHLNERTDKIDMEYNQQTNQNSAQQKQNNMRRTRRRQAGFFYIILPWFIVTIVQNLLSIFTSQATVFFEAFTFKGHSFLDFITDARSALSSSMFHAVVLSAYAVICIIWFGIWYNREFLEQEEPARKFSCLFRQYRHWKWFLYPGLVLFAIGVQYLATYIMNALAAAFPSWLDTYMDMLNSSGLDSSKEPLILVIYAVFLGPVCEELTFRGLTFGYARRSMGFWAANFVQALLFGMFHMNMLQGVMAFLLGLAFGYIYEKTQNLTVTMLVHILFNSISQFLPQIIYNASHPWEYFACVLGGLIAAYIGLWLIVRATQRNIVEVD